MRDISYCVCSPLSVPVAGAPCVKPLRHTQARSYAANYVSKEVDAAAWEKPGRFWGIWGRENLPLSRVVVYAVDRAVACRFARVMRRYLGSRTKRRVRCVRRLCTEQHLQWLRVLVWAEGFTPPAHDFNRHVCALCSKIDGDQPAIGLRSDAEKADSKPPSGKRYRVCLCRIALLRFRNGASRNNQPQLFCGRLKG